jgi:hypothetical protein
VALGRIDCPLADIFSADLPCLLAGNLVGRLVLMDEDRAVWSELGGDCRGLDAQLFLPTTGSGGGRATDVAYPEPLV